MNASGRAIRLLTLNVNGLGGPSRAAAMLEFVVSVCGQPDVVCLQELHVHDASVLSARLASGRGPGLPFKCAHFASLGTSHARGVAVLLSNRISGLAGTAITHASDPHGRLVRVDLTLLGRQLSLVSLYAPNAGLGNAAFFNDELRPFLPPDRLCLVGGDFNCILDALDQSSAGVGRFSGAATLRAVMHGAGLVDAYRHLAPAGREYTHIDTHGHSAARLDRWLVPQPCLSWVGSVQHLHGGPGDHAGTLLSLLLPDMPSFGPGICSFPLHVLYDTQLLSKLRDRLHAFEEAHAAGTAPGERWAHWVQLKEFLLTAGRMLSRAARREKIQALRRQSKALQRAQRGAAGAPSAPALSAWRTAIADMQGEVWAQSGRLSFAASAMWRDHGERTTAWHFAQAGRAHSHEPPRSFTAADGSVHDMRMVRSGVDLGDLVWGHFSGEAPEGLFAVRPTRPEAQQQLLAGVPCLSALQVRPAAGPTGDGSITDVCLTAALSSCSLGTAPGRDGLPYEVYKVLWAELSEALVAALDDLFTLPGAPPAAWAEGIILPIYKENKGLPRDRLASYRPITLLNTDLKLAQRVLSDRLQRPLDLWVSPAQTAFLRGRSIADNVLMTQRLMEYLEAAGQPGAMLVLDIKQAYDRVDRQWLTACAQRMGLPAGYMRWLHLFMANTRSRVMLNGHVSPDFAVLNGLPQGGPLAPLLWVLQLQPFTAALERAQSAGLLRSPLLPSGDQAPPVSHHADDTKLYLRDLAADGAAALACIGQYKDASGAEMHQDKNKGVCMGSHAPVHGVDLVTRAVFAAPGAPPVTSLGVPCTTDMLDAAAIVYPRRLASIRGLHYLWRRFPLSMVGRTLNAKQLMGNTICYHVSFVPPPAADLKAMGDAIINHITSSTLSEDLTIGTGGGRLQLLPKRAIACLPYCMGGLSVPDLPSQAASLQAKVLADAFSPGPHAWKTLMQHALAEAAPAPALGPVWVLMPSVPVPAGLSLSLAAYVTALRSCQPSFEHSNFDTLPFRALLLLPVQSVHALYPGLPALPLQPPADWPYLLGQLATCAPELRASPSLATLEATMPDRLKAAVAAAAGGEEALEQHDLVAVSRWLFGGSCQRPGWASRRLLRLCGRALGRTTRPCRVRPVHGSARLRSCGAQAEVPVVGC